MKLKVVFFQRKPIPNFHFSVEIIFNDVRKYLSERISTVIWIGKYFSSGLVNRMHLAVSAWFHQGDINHVTGDISFVGILMGKNKTVQTILDCGFLNIQKGIRRFILKKIWLDWPVHRAKLVTTISEQVKSEIVHLTNCPPGKIHVIHIAKSDVYVPRPNRNISTVPNILVVGSAPNKNFERIFRALQGLECEVHVIGKYVEKYEKLLKENNLKYVYSTGFSQQQMLAKYYEMDLLIFASIYEGFGMPIIEAQAVGVPVITSNCSSMPEVAGEGALLVNPYEVDEIKEGVIMILRDSEFRKKLVQNGFANVLRFSPLIIARKYEELYWSIYGNNTIV
jgi:glycosyltransferase involved in cell wall biosynthesis